MPTGAGTRITGDAQEWEVVGGSRSGGILVKVGSETDSAQESSRLSTGARVKELELKGNRLHYELLAGSGPSSGWVSLKFQDKDLLVRTSPGTADAAYADANKPSSQEWLPITGRKVRVLAVHSAPSNSNIMKFQAVQLKKALGKDFEWLFVDAPNLWECREIPPGHPEGMPVDPAWVLYGGKRSDFETRLANGMPFHEWLRFDEDARRPTAESAAKSDRYLRDYIEKEAPIDVIIAMSQGSCITAQLLENLRIEGRAAPWRLSVFFSSVPPEAHFPTDLPVETMKHSVIAVLGGERDPWHAIGKSALPLRYSGPVILEHEDGHVFPFTEPKAGQLYGQLASMIRSACGLPG